MRVLLLLVLGHLHVIASTGSMAHTMGAPSGIVEFHCQTGIPPGDGDPLVAMAKRRATPASAWTEGRKRLLLVRVDFTDLPGAPFSAAQGTNLLAELDTFFTEMSFGRAGFHPPGAGSDYTPVYRMPRSAAIYGVLDPSQLRTDALAAAKAGGFDPASYDLDVICVGNVAGYRFTGFAYVGVRGAWVKNAFSNAGPIAHELGHNLGLNHANLWDTAGFGVVGPGREAEYGDTSDTMSLSTGYSRHFNARTKRLLDWLDEAHIGTPSSNGVYRVFAHDVTNAAAGPRALRITRNSRTNYWLEFRDRHTNSPIASQSLAIRWATATNRPTLLLDTTPGSAPGARDAFLRPGRTFSDLSHHLHVTTLGRINTTPPALDVDIRFGPFPGNRPPTASISPGSAGISVGELVQFQVTASDPDGDVLSYGWDPGDESVPADQPGFSRSFPAEGDYIVQCVVSDRRGGTSTVRSVVRVGSPTGFRLAGRVLQDGSPVDGATLVAGPTRVARSDREGTHLSVGLPNGPQVITPYLEGFAFVPRSRAVTVDGSDVGGIDFTAYALADLEPVPFVAAQATWRYLDTGADPGTSWKTNTFADGAWKQGPAPLGYGFADLGTTVSFGPNPNGKWVTTFFRKTFNVADTSQWLALRLNLQSDDGAVVHLNGVEVARSNMKEGTFNFLTFATDDVVGDDERNFQPFLIDPGLLREGSNLIAVEIHQFTNSTPDCRFDARLEGLRVPVLIPPTFDTTPVSTTVVLGKTATLAATASGTAPLAFAWFKGTSTSPAGSLPSLSFGAASTNDAGSYRVVISNAAGSVTSAPVTLTVLVPPSIDVAPTPLTVVQGQPATLTVAASGTVPLSFAWFKGTSTSPVGSLPSLSFGAASTNDADSYRVVISNAAGSVTSSPVILTVLVPPSIVTQPTGISLNEGQTLFLNAAATGTSPLAFQWQRSGTNIPGATSAVLEIARVSPSDSGEYRLEVRNTAGSALSEIAQVTVRIPGAAATLAMRLEGGQLTGCLQGTPGARYLIERSTDLSDWALLAEITLPASGSDCMVIEPEGTGAFLRARGID